MRMSLRLELPVRLTLPAAIFLSALLLAAFLSLAPGHAFADINDDCTSTDAAIAIPACTKLIEGGERSGQPLANAHYNRALRYREQGDEASALNDINAAIGIYKKDADFYDMRANIYYSMPIYEKALEDFVQYTKLVPREATGYFNQAICQKELGDYASALRNLDKADRISPNDAETVRELGIVHAKKGEFETGLNLLNRSIELSNQDGLAYNWRGRVLIDLGRHEEAVRDLDRALELDSNQPDVYGNRAFAKMALGRYTETLADYDKAIAAYPREAGYYNNRGETKFKIGDARAAIKDLDQALAIDSALGDAYFNRAAAEESIGLNEAALADYRRALEHAPLPENRDSVARRKIEDLNQQVSVLGRGGSAERKGAPTSNFAPIIANGKRIALVIGNGAYQHMPALDNPAHDAQDMANALEKLGFTVTLAIDADRLTMEDKLASFARQARESEIALAFYAGHGMQNDGINYLIPVDGELNDTTDIRRFIAVKDLIADLRNAKNVRILILDACRDNEALLQLAASLPKTRSSALDKGLADEKAEGVLIAFATQPGKVAEDTAGGRNSPFTSALINNLDTPGLDVRLVMTRVRAEVVKATDGRQRPEVSDSLIGEFSFR